MNCCLFPVKLLLLCFVRMESQVSVQHTSGSWMWKLLRVLACGMPKSSVVLDKTTRFLGCWVVEMRRDHSASPLIVYIEVNSEFGAISRQKYKHGIPFTLSGFILFIKGNVLFLRVVVRRSLRL